jgi:hypothetical protein
VGELDGHGTQAPIFSSHPLAIHGVNKPGAMAANIEQKKKDELIWARDALEKNENPLSEEEAHFAQECCCILINYRDG